MTVTRIVPEVVAIGAGSSKGVDPFKSIAGIIVTTDGFSIATTELASTKATWEAGIKAKTVFPIFGNQFWGYEDVSADAVIPESDLGNRAVMRDSKYRFNFSLWQPLSVHQLLRTFNDLDMRVFFVDEAGTLFYTVEDNVIKGFSTSLFYLGAKKFVPANGDSPSIATLMIDFNDEEEWNENGDYVPNVAFGLKKLTPLTTVYLESVSASATSVVMRVYTTDGNASDGTINKSGVAGINCEVSGDNDFVASLTGTVSAIADNGDGTYTFTGTSLATGTIGMVAATAMTSDFSKLYIEASAPVAITIGS